MSGVMMSITGGMKAAVAMLAALVLAAGCSKREPQPLEQARFFSTPEQAVQALIAALEQNELSHAERLLGTQEVLSSGDDVADQAARKEFLRRYHERSELVAGGPNDLVLQVGEDRWPLPIPLIRSAGFWSFDGPAGAEELVLRRIGRNELRTIQVMRGYVEAQHEYASGSHDGAAA